MTPVHRLGLGLCLFTLVGASTSLGPGASAQAIPERTRPGNLEITAPQGRHVLGKFAQLTFSIAGAPASTPPEIRVSTGTVKAVEPRGAGQWDVQWLPPDDTAPQVVLLAARSASSAGEQRGFATVPLIGTAELPVTTDPSATVTVLVSDISFGPVPADAKGAAPVPIEVPPGVSSALARSTDSRGHVTEQVIRLPVPPFTRILALAPQELAPGQTAHLDLLVVDPTGAPLPRTVLRAYVPGRLLDVTPDEAPAGITHSFLMRAPPALASARKILMHIEGEDGVLRSSVEILLVLGAAQRLTASVDPPRVRYGRRVVITARALDAQGNAAMTVPRIEVAGKVVTPSESAPGRVTVELTAPTRFPGKPELPVRISAAPAPDMLLAVGLEAGAPVELSIAPELPRALGGSSIRVNVRARDAAGAPAATDIDVRGEDGARAQLSGCNDHGACMYALAVPQVRRSRSYGVTASAGGLTARTRLGLYPGAVRLDASVMLDAMTNLGQIEQAGLTAALRWRALHGLLVSLTPRLVRGSFEARDSTGSSTITLTQVPLLAGAAYERTLSPHTFASLGAVLGLNVASLRTKSAGEPAFSDNALGFAFGLEGSFEIQAGPGRVVVAAGYVSSRLAEAGLDGETLGLRLGAGYALTLR